MFVHVLADTSDKLFGICSLLERKFTVAGERLDVEGKLPQAPVAVVVRADLRAVENIAALKKRASRFAKVSKRIFLSRRGDALGVVVNRRRTRARPAVCRAGRAHTQTGARVTAVRP